MANISIIGWFTKYYFGNSNSNDLYGSDLYGDRMYGRGGDDTFHSSLGPDYFNGGTGFDTVDYSDSDSAVDVRLYRGKGYGGDAQGDTYYGIEGLVGSNYGDNLHGNFANNTLDGGGGNDYLYGYSGNDTFIASDGRNYINGGSGVDTVDYSGLAIPELSGGVLVDLAAGYGKFDRLTIDWDIFDIYNSIENAIGTVGNDKLVGNDRTNEIAGGNGIDQLYGGHGDDNLEGGADSDTFFFSTGDGDDTIVDFSGQNNNGDGDKISLGDYGFSGWWDLKYLDNGDKMRSVNDGRDTEIYNKNGDTILLQGVDIDDLSSNDFIF